MSFDSEVLKKVFKNFEKKELTDFNIDYQCCSMLKTDYMRVVKGITRNASTAEVLENSKFFERFESEVKKTTESEQEVLDEKKQMISTMIKSRKSSANTGMKQLILIKKLYNKALTELKMNHGSMLTDTDLSRLEIPVELDIDTYIDNSDIVLKKKA
jgi:hypothetical protein